MNTLKSILLHLDGSARCVERVHVARHLAEAFDAEVSGLYCVTPSIWRYPAAAESALISGELFEIDRQEQDRAEAAFVSASANSPLMSWLEPKGIAPWDFARQALYSDLMVMGQRNPDDPASAETPPEFLAATLLESGRPALILPYAGPIEPVGSTVLVAWKEAREAASAVAAAMSLLRKASKVHVICYADEPQPALQALQRYLLRHGVSAILHRGAPEQGSSGEMLLSEASDLGADLLVMGCYGHSRAREWIFGGATRTVLEAMTLPVLMAH